MQARNEVYFELSINLDCCDGWTINTWIFVALRRISITRMLGGCFGRVIRIDLEPEAALQECLYCRSFLDSLPSSLFIGY